MPCPSFDFKDLHNEKSQSVISGDLGGHACGKNRLIMGSSPKLSVSGTTICGGAPSCIKVIVCITCRTCSSGMILIYNNAAYRSQVTDTVFKHVSETFSK
ncbi:hypothetical protein AVEN_34086-1 [Araneus ventricosus]|uniref:Uncharacterized protein n=1 Tax=Araneus ventricosus TaxID=182803 RepID=A0A4Y2G7S5_ARAVE|nr:hypothetical protein AVEN_34086-1 [Araneus ventricosus]